MLLTWWSASRGVQWGGSPSSSRKRNVNAETTTSLRYGAWHYIDNFNDINAGKTMTKFCEVYDYYICLTILGTLSMLRHFEMRVYSKITIQFWFLVKNNFRHSGVVIHAGTKVKRVCTNQKIVLKGKKYKISWCNFIDRITVLGLFSDWTKSILNPKETKWTPNCFSPSW